MKSKACTKCNEVKSLNNFPLRKDTGKYRNHCKECGKQYHKKWEEDNRDYVNRKSKEYARKNPEKIKANNKKYRQNNYDKIREYQKQWVEENKERHLKTRRAYNNKKFNNDVCFRIGKLLRNRLNYAIKNIQKSGSAVKDLGCTIEELKLHLESKFSIHPVTEKQMNWDNQGVHRKVDTSAYANGRSDV